MISEKKRFDIKTLREMVGEKIYDRGVDYFRNGDVQILSLNPKRVVARVAGTEDYRTELTGGGKEFGGTCSCPAYRDWGYCKHMVAVALAANDAAAGLDGDGVGTLARIRKHLTAMSADQLVDIILDQAERHPALFRKLDVESALTQADDATLEKQLRQAIDAATRTGTYIEYRKARQWNDGVDSALDAAEKIADGPRASVALKVIERAIERILAASGSIDDSDGHIGGLLGRARDIHLAAVTAARPEPRALARSLFGLETAYDMESFSHAVIDYADTLGETGLAEYRRLAEAEWSKLRKSTGRKREAAEDLLRTNAVTAILDFFAERDGDLEARIALRASDLSSPWRYLQLAEFCLSLGRVEEALRRAEEGLWQFEDHGPDEGLLLFMVDLLRRAGRKADAETRLWQAFQKAPSFALYRKLREIGGMPATERALGLLESQLGGKKHDLWYDQRSLLLELLMEDKQFEAAWSALQKFGAPDHMKERLVKATDLSHPREALDFYAVLVERFAGSAAYSEAMKVIGRMAKLRSADEQAAYVAELKVRHDRKRNFMKLLG